MKVNQRNLNEDIKVFFIDLDGTLLDYRTVDGQKRMSSRNLKAIAQATKENKTIVISTGRMGVNAMPHLKAIRAKYAILANGAQVLVDNKIVRDLKISIRQVLLVLGFAQKHGLVLKIDDAYVAWGVNNGFKRLISNRFGYVPNSGFHFPMHQEYSKFVLWGKSPKKMLLLAAQLEDEVEGIRATTASKNYTIEVTHRDATKGMASSFLLENYLKVPIKNTAHIGDSMNDSSVIGHVGRFIVMQNGSRILRKASRYVGPRYKNGGVAKILDGKYRTKRKFLVGKNAGFSALF